MSIKVMTAVFERYPNGGGEMLLALALADHASDDGTKVFPSVEALAEKTRQSVRSVQYQLRSMQASGWLILVSAGNGGRSMTSEYRISLDWIKGAEIAPFQKGATDDEKGANDDAKGCNPQQKRVQPVAPANNRHRTIIEPSVNLVAGAKPAKPSGRSTVLPGNFEPNDTAVQMARDFGLSLADQQAAFEDHHAAKGSTFRDWQAAFRTWLRNSQKFARSSIAWRAHQPIDQNAPVETYAQRAARQRMEEVAPMAARKVGQPSAFDRAQAFMRGVDVIDASPKQQMIGGSNGR